DLGRTDRPDPFRVDGCDTADHGLDGMGDGLSVPRGRRAVIHGAFARSRRTAVFTALWAAALVLGGCHDDDPFDPVSQIGPNPVLPEPHQYLFPPMHLSSVRGWKAGEKPTAVTGLKVEALATGLEHPRSLYVLPNGDVLVVESKAPSAPPISRPKDLVMQWIESQTTSSGA